MSVMNKGQRKSSSDSLENSESAFQFYGGMSWKQDISLSQYHYCNMPTATFEVQVEQGDKWEHILLLRDKCINFTKNTLSKINN